MLTAIVCLSAALALRAPAAAPPDTDICLAPLSTSGASLLVSQPADITHGPGDDNQPSFTPDGAAMLFTSVRVRLHGVSRLAVSPKGDRLALVADHPR